MMDDDDEVPCLSAHTLAALEEFYREQSEKLFVSTDDTDDDVKIEENWQLSQFWYNDETARALATECVRIAGLNGSIACISCPTLYKKLRMMKSSVGEIKLFEFDRRFSVFEDDFIFYDYQDPLNIKEEHKTKYEVVVADPPYLSEECMERVASTIKYLSKNIIILCTGTIMENLLKDLLDLKMCTFKPMHARSLGNSFSCYANYDLDAFIPSESFTSSSNDS